MPTHFAGEPDEILALDTLIKLTRATNTLLARIAHHNTHPDLTVSQFGTLEALYHLGTISQTDICGKLLKSGGNTTLVIDNLEKRDLVRRRRRAVLGHGSDLRELGRADRLRRRRRLPQ